MSGLVIGRVSQNDFEDLRYTAKKAIETTKFWKEKFSEIDLEDLTAETLLSKTDSLYITPKDLYNVESIWPSYILNREVFHAMMRTSGTTGEPKRIPFTKDDKRRVSRQIAPWVTKYMDKGDKIASFFPLLPSSSGVFAYGGFEELGMRVGYYQIPIQYLMKPDLLLKELKSIKPTALFCLTTTAYLLGLKLPEEIRNDISVIVLGGETLTEEMAKAMLTYFENAMIVDNFGASEEGVTGYRLITKNRIEPFKFPESVLILKERDGEDEYKEYYKLYLTKVMREGELTGLPIFNYDIGDFARVVNGEITSIIRVKDVISLAGAKLHIDQVMNIVYRYSFLTDFVIIYHPLSPNNPKPKAIIRVGYVEKFSGIEDEIRSLIYQANNPVRYEVEESKQAELIIEAVPASELRKDLPQKPGKTKRIYIVGKDI
ncbi:hypothetical protein PAP_07775 [Palaeococcus pacificus DY20341]|uniref:AMP-dependent synthetase/ligase domain-containing protein n=1 Tax=Palaeococcus pacificus DY20341 TaxID=1343739 RepID=A0A075LU96_9EURY|nr:AMP-binding protein [Palaeococcus pacificus]AIF69944.1 hypothetical protein PAP_07775 [Palaeococcus pacificus DY20341]